MVSCLGQKNKSYLTVYICFDSVRLLRKVTMNLNTDKNYCKGIKQRQVY